MKICPKFSSIESLLFPSLIHFMARGNVSRAKDRNELTFSYCGTTCQKIVNVVYRNAGRNVRNEAISNKTSSLLRGQAHFPYSRMMTRDVLQHGINGMQRSRGGRVMT